MDQGQTTTPSEPQAPHPLAERIVEQVIFSGRWVLAPIYLGLIVGLIMLAIKFALHVVELASHIMSASDDETIIGVLSLIDLSLMGSLVVMVMFAGYENFVSKLDLAGHKDTPDWLGKVDFGDLKLKLLASIVAISAIHLLGNFMTVEETSDRVLMWGVGIMMAFALCGVLVAIMDRVAGHGHT